MDDIKALVKAIAQANRHPDPDSYVEQVVNCLASPAPAQEKPVEESIDKPSDQPAEHTEGA